MNTLTVSIQKLEYGGYVMAVGTDGQTPPSQAQFAATTLQELYNHQHHLAANHFKESPLPAPMPVSHFQLQPRPAHPMPAPPQFDTTRHDQVGGEHDPDMPRVATGPQTEDPEVQGLASRIGRIWPNGGGAHMIAPLFVALVGLSLAVGRLA